MKKILHNAKVYVEKGCYAQAVLIDGGLISLVGTNEEILAHSAEAALVYDCKGKTLIPGLNDAHMHLEQYAEVLNQANIEGVTSIDEMIQRCIDFKNTHPDKVKNGLHAIGWNQDFFTDEKRIPTRFDLDKISTEIPIVLERVCGHICSGNTKLLEALGLDENSPQFPNGEFEKDENGFPNGIFKGAAVSYAKDVIPDFTLAEKREILIDAMRHAVSMGITSIQSNDIGADFPNPVDGYALINDIYEKGDALLRYRHQSRFKDLAEFKKYLEGELCFKRYAKGSWIQYGPLKLFKDGSLGARTALMKDGYVGDPENHGLEWLSAAEMDEFCALAKDAGMQVVTHCIGSKAVEDTIKSYEKAFINGKNELRHALVHCQVTDKETLDRIIADDILVLAQPVFIDYDMHIVEELCGAELASTSYAFGTLLRRGAHLAYSTDCPVESCNPFPNIYHAVTRKDKSGNPPEGFHPDECVDVETAVDAYTAGSAYAEFAEDFKGRIKPGYYADMTLLDKDIFTIDTMEIKDIKPVLTMVGGEIVFER